MENLNKIEKDLLEQIAGLHEIPEGAYNIRKDGKLLSRRVNANIDIVSKEDKPGIDIFIKPGTKNQSIHIPVIVAEAGLKDLVYNDFHIGKDCDVTIVAGCGIACGSSEDEGHDGIHSFYLEENARVVYIEKHLAVGGGKGKRILNPITNIEMKKNSYMKMETSQLGGVTSSVRDTNAVLGEGAKLEINEKIMTADDDYAETNFNVDLNGKDCSTHVVSRAVAKNNSHQVFKSVVNGNNKCFGHTECDAIIMDKANIIAKPEITASSTDASLIHEAAIGKIAGEQIVKLQTLGLTEAEAEQEIISGFLK
ncbi:MAG: SufD family Fe-S cluster assembly protein [Clostridia bacterium]|nr:SufD family Fe-S cluster assembly protein [Clostridiales bacterium]MBQ7917297.1 SufD family Fe-S cluster assembly protein [Clostridia bacterium]